MSTEKSERILAALSRAKASRPSNTLPTLEASEEPEAPQPRVELSEKESESAAPEIESDSSQSSPA